MTFYRVHFTSKRTGLQAMAAGVYSDATKAENCAALYRRLGYSGVHITVARWR